MNRYSKLAALTIAFAENPFLDSCIAIHAFPLRLGTSTIIQSRQPERPQKRLGSLSLDVNGKINVKLHEGIIPLIGGRDTKPSIEDSTLVVVEEAEKTIRRDPSHQHIQDEQSIIDYLVCNQIF